LAGWKKDKRMEIACETQGTTLIARVLEDRIDAAVAIRFKDRMRDLVQSPSDRVILDLSRVGFLDSSGLGAVVAVMKLVGPDRKLELSGLTPTVEKVFRLTRMDRVFTIHSDVAGGAPHVA
jgi:anti-sigma B factor antagonist